MSPNEPDPGREWPSGEQVQAYFAGYAWEFGLDELIQLNTVLQRARRDRTARGGP